MKELSREQGKEDLRAPTNLDLHAEVFYRLLRFGEEKTGRPQLSIFGYTADLLASHSPNHWFGTDIKELDKINLYPNLQISQDTRTFPEALWGYGDSNQSGIVLYSEDALSGQRGAIPKQNIPWDINNNLFGNYRDINANEDIYPYGTPFLN